MFWSQLYAPLKKNVSSDIDSVSHQNLLKAGMIQQAASGVFNFLPLGQRVLSKIVSIVDSEMAGIGANKIFLSSLQPFDFWEKTGRNGTYGENLMQLKDRHDKKLVLGPTCEEAVCQMVANDLNSYKQLPVFLYQVSNKFRDEYRPQHGLFRAREFLMKDGYSFHADAASLDETYHNVDKAYEKIFNRCHLKFNVGKADNGDMGGDESWEYSAVTKNEKMGEIEVGHIFKLGDKYTKAFGVSVLDAFGSKITPLMGCYGIGISRMLVAILEQNSDAQGAVFNKETAPYQVVITPIKFDGEMAKKAMWLAALIEQLKGVDVLIDDRDVRPGVKFAEADALGIPYRITISEKLGDNFELKERTASRENVTIFTAEQVEKLNL